MPPRKWMTVGLVGLLAFFALFVIYSGVLKVKMPEGTLEFLQLPENADVFVDGEKVFMTWSTVREKATISIPAGTHQVEVQKNGIKIDKTSVIVSSGEKTQLVVRVEPVPPPDRTPPVPTNQQSVRQPSSSELNTFTNSLGMKMVYIPPLGEFWMGSPTSEVYHQSAEYQHNVRLTEGYYLGAHEVTRGQFAEFVASGYTKNRKWKVPGFEQSDDHPVVNVSYEDAVAFAKWLSKKESRLYSLPSEAEWEFACRGVRGESSSDSTPYWFGQEISQLQDYANIEGQGHKDEFAETSPVGSFQPNPFGFYDMHGNVWEWCSDWYGAKYYENSPVKNPQGPRSGSDRVIRGGSWNYSPEFSRSAFRTRGRSSTRLYNLGFRLRSSVN